MTLIPTLFDVGLSRRDPVLLFNIHQSPKFGRVIMFAGSGPQFPQTLRRGLIASPCPAHDIAFPLAEGLGLISVVKGLPTYG